VNRFEKQPIEKNIGFYQSVFSHSELEHCKKFSNPYPHLAGIFAAKEATIKCLDKPISMSEMHTFWDEKGKPYINIIKERIRVNISISHTQTLAIAVAMITI
jgi:holo-[acyl-carrier-protein] synthase